VPYPGTVYAELTAEKLLESVAMYEKFYQDRQYDLILSNGEQLEFEIACKNLCHMLGIEHKNLISDYFTEFRRDTFRVDVSLLEVFQRVGCVKTICLFLPFHVFGQTYKVDDEKQSLLFHARLLVFQKLLIVLG